MLLLDLLATRLSRWPTGATYISQGRETGNLYDHNGDLLKPKTIYPTADNAGAKAIVYRVEWLARRRELAAETEEAPTTAPLSPAQRIAKASAEEVEPVQEQGRNPHHHVISIAGCAPVGGTPEKLFEPFDFSGPVLGYSLKKPGTMPEPMTPIQYRGTDGAWIDGTYVGKVYGRIVAGCDLTKTVGWYDSGELRVRPSMTLLEILAKHWACWPIDYPISVWQKSDGGIYPLGYFSGDPISILPIALDQDGAKVTRDKWSWHRTNHPEKIETKDRQGWDDRGYPLKGTTCEYNVAKASKKGIYITVAIKYASPATVVFECIYKPEGVETATIGQEYTAIPSGFSNPFRPIRSPSEIAAEELADKVDAMLALDSSSGMLSRREFCLELIKAGYSPAIESDLSRTATLAKLSEAYLQGARDHRGGLEAIYDHGFRLLSPPEKKADQ